MSGGRKRLILILALVFVGAVVAVVVWPGEREPEYQGKKLSEWIVLHERAASYETTEAFRHIGSNAVPCLLRWLQQKTICRDKLHIILLRMPPLLQSDRLLRWTDRSEGKHPRNLAYVGFYAIGPDAAGAVPVLERLMNDPASPEISLRAIDALIAINEPAYEALARSQAVNSDNADVRERITWAREMVPPEILKKGVSGRGARGGDGK